MRKWAASLLGLVALVVVVASAIGWYFSGMVIEAEPERSTDSEVTANNGDTITLKRTPRNDSRGTYAVGWAGRQARVGDIVTANEDTVTRTLLDKPGPPTGTTIQWLDDIWAGNPRDTRNVEFTDLPVQTELGPTPAWLIPGTSSTWIIAVHGRGGDRGEYLRVLPALASTGMPVLATTYRNDDWAPVSKDGHGHLGDTEWRDVDAAIRHAKQNGATGVVLYGWSMGGAMTLETLQRSADASLIRGVVLDAPLLDWRDVLDYQGGLKGLPLPLTRVAEQFVSWRIDFDYDEFDQVRDASSLRVPVLLFRSGDDTKVPPGPAAEFAAAKPDLVKLEDFPNAEHTSAWNDDPERYERALTEFLQGVR